MGICLPAAPFAPRVLQAMAVSLALPCVRLVCLAITPQGPWYALFALLVTSAAHPSVRFNVKLAISALQGRLNTQLVLLPTIALSAALQKHRVQQATIAQMHTRRPSVLQATFARNGRHR